jgi:hypothetical protein
VLIGNKEAFHAGCYMTSDGMFSPPGRPGRHAMACPTKLIIAPVAIAIEERLDLRVHGRLQHAPSPLPHQLIERTLPLELHAKSKNLGIAGDVRWHFVPDHRTLDHGVSSCPCGLLKFLLHHQQDTPLFSLPSSTQLSMGRQKVSDVDHSSASEMINKELTSTKRFSLNLQPTFCRRVNFR